MVDQAGDLAGEEPEPRASLTTVAYNLIEKQLIVGEIPPGALLSEASLSKAIGIGRTPVREALQRLARERLVTIIQRKGARVSAIDIDQYMAGLSLRREVERVIVSNVALTASWPQRQSLHQLAAGLREAVESGDLAKALEMDRRFKLLEMEICENQFLSAAVRPLYGLARRFYFAQAVEPVRAVGLAQAALIDHIARGDADAAGRASDAFIEALARFGAEVGKPVGARTDEHSEIADIELRLADRAYDLIEWKIVTGAYAVDELLSEGQLSQELGLGRTPVREALQRLAAHRLVTIVPRRGLLVTNFDAYDLSRLTEARRPLESMLCRLAARHASREDRQRLAEVVEGIDGVTDYENGSAITLDQSAKTLLLKAAGNVFLADAIAPVHGLSRALYFRKRSAPDLDVVRAQLSMLRAVVRGDEAEAGLGAIRFVAEVARVMHQRREIWR